MKPAPANHPDIALSLNNLAGVLQAQARLTEAARRRISTSPSASTTWLYQEQRQLIEAEPRLLRHPLPDILATPVSI
jgi:hypothetical protein